MSPPTILILGAGPGIGASVASAFSAKGFRVAIAARSFQDGIDDNGFLRLHIDLANPAEIAPVFEKVKERFGVPSVVVYNGALRISRDVEDPLEGMTMASLHEEFAINMLSPLIAAQGAVKGFKTLPDSASRTFIFTGNALNSMRLEWPFVMAFGMGKSATAYMIHDASVAYGKRGFKFYYVDERQEDGGPTIPVGGPAAGRAYVELAEDKEQRPWNYTFVDGEGYVQFEQLLLKP